MDSKHDFNGPYTGDYLNRVAFPLGGIGAGMMCLDGTGALSHVSLRHKPDVFNAPRQFAALHVKGDRATTRVLEGQVPMWKAFGQPGTANGAGETSYGLPRFSDAEFRTHFPFATVAMKDPSTFVEVELTGWSPFVPADADSSSLPVCALEYTLHNRGEVPVDTVFSYHAENFMRVNKESGAYVRAMNNGFILCQPQTEEKPSEEGYFAAWVDAEGSVASAEVGRSRPRRGPASSAGEGLAETASPTHSRGSQNIHVDCGWFRGGWFDAFTMTWKSIAAGETPERGPHEEGASSRGASLYVPVHLGVRGKETVRLLLSWYVPTSDVRTGPDLEGEGEDGKPKPTYEAWYTGRFKSIDEVVTHWSENCDELRARSAAFSDCFYDSTLAPEVIEAVAANLTILKSPTCLRQADGRFWAYEGCCDGNGCCHGSCTHVWDYAQALPHLFPDLERSLRETEYLVSQDETGHQNFRTSLPIRPTDHKFHAAADGQLGAIIRTYREWRIGGDIDWLRGLWSRVVQSLGYCIETWDPEHKGILEEPHHNTYDIEFWGPDGMCTSFYLGALRAVILMGEALGEDISLYAELLQRGKQYMESELWNGEYFYQKIQWEGLKAGDPTEVPSMQRDYSSEALDLLKKEGPKYQYGAGCLTDGILGEWIAEMCGMGGVLDAAKVDAHVQSVHRNNFKPDMGDHANTQRPSYAFGREGGLLICTWPHGGALSLPFPYSNEVWTGIDYQVASHLMVLGHVEEGLQIVRAARARYDGRCRNPFNEFECGHWYARAMSSYGMLQGLTGARYDAVEKVLYLAPSIKGDFRSFLSTATGFGTVGVKGGQPFLDVKSGRIDAARIEYAACGG